MEQNPDKVTVIHTGFTALVVCMRSVPHILMCLNTWFSAAGTIWEVVEPPEGRGLLEETRH